jgi:carboxypeptidase T
MLLIAALGAGNAAAATFSDGNLYQSFEQMTAWASSFATVNSDVVRLVNYGTTSGGRPLLALNITVNPTADDPNKPEFLFAAGIHAREVISSQSAYKLAEYLVAGYRSGDAKFQNILSTRDVWIIPNQNPDGRVVVESGYGDQRKNDHWYAGQPLPATGNSWARGVDLNRNYPHQWSRASPYVTDETYRGPSALSEPEAKGLWDLVHDTSRFSRLLAAIDIHSGASTIIAPWISANDPSPPLPADTRTKFNSLTARMSQLTGYSTNRLSYDSYGTLSDSLYEEFGTYAVTEEVFMGSGDTFTFFNPTNSTTRDATVDKVISSAMYTLSDEAFAVPEPSVFVLLLAGGTLLACIARRRTGRGAR